MTDEIKIPEEVDSPDPITLDAVWSPVQDDE